MTALIPIRREIVVSAEPELAFAVFTERIATWWPLVQFSVHGAAATVAFVDGRIIESAPGQPDAVWGTVTEWTPPAALAFTWHPGRDPQNAGRVSVAFTPIDTGTLVRLEHSGWEAFADPIAGRAEYDHGWPVVLAGYAAMIEAAPARTLD